MKTNKYLILVDLICMLLLTTLTQTLMPINLNRYIGFFLLFVILKIFIDNSDKKGIWLISSCFFCAFISFFSAESASKNLSNVVYWIIAICTIYISSSATFRNKLMKAFCKRNRFLLGVVIVADIILCASLATPKAYMNIWNEIYFVGFTAHQHTVASACCLIMAFSLLELYISPTAPNMFPFKTFVLCFPALLAVFESSARIFLVPGIIILGYIVLYKINNASIKMLSVPPTLIILGFVFLNSNMFKRITSLSGAESGAYTSGRSSFWLADIKAYMGFNFFYKLFGHGFDYIQAINLKVTRTAIGAHNDYITLLIGVGAIGLLLYLAVLAYELKNNMKADSIIKKLFLMAFWMITSFFNGFYGYQLLLYSYLIFKMVLIEDSNNLKRLESGKIK